MRRLMFISFSLLVFTLSQRLAPADTRELSIERAFDVVGATLATLSGMLIFGLLIRSILRRANLPKDPSFKPQNTPADAAIRKAFEPIVPPAPPVNRAPSVLDGTPLCPGGR